MWLPRWPGCCCHLNSGLDPFTLSAFTVCACYSCQWIWNDSHSGFNSVVILCVTFGSSFEVSILIAAYLDSFSQTRLFISCLVIQVDRTDVALGATSIRLQCHSQPWTVPTPPLQSFSVTSYSSDSVPLEFVFFRWT